MHATHTESTGESRCVILHSNGMSADFYSPVAARLAQRGIATTAFTLPGFMGTEPLADGSLLSLLRHIEPEVREALGDDGILVGHSLGGVLAFLLAARLPVGRLVLLEPAMVPFGVLTRWFASWYRRGAVDVAPGFRNRGPFFWRLHDPSRFPAEGWALVERSARTTDPEVVRRLLASSDQAVPLPFSDVRCPVTLVRGGSSGWVLHLAQRLLAARMVDARCVTLAEAGHWMVFEADDALADAIADDAARPVGSAYVGWVDGG